MNHDRLIRALNNAGFTIEDNGHQYFCKGAKRVVTWYKQDDSAICFNSRRHNDHHDSQSDYSAGYFCRTIKSAVNSLIESEV